MKIYSAFYRVYRIDACPFLLLFFLMQQPLVGQGLLIKEDSRSHSGTPHLVGLLWTSDQPDAVTFT
jgi:hypothetical protein